MGGGWGLIGLGQGAKRTKRPPEAAEAAVPPAASNAAAKAAVLRGRGAAASAVRVVSRSLATVWLQPAASPFATARCTRLTRDTSHSGKGEGEEIASCSPLPACSSCVTGEWGVRCATGEWAGSISARAHLQRICTSEEGGAQEDLGHRGVFCVFEQLRPVFGEGSNGNLRAQRWRGCKCRSDSVNWPTHVQVRDVFRPQQRQGRLAVLAGR